MDKVHHLLATATPDKGLVNAKGMGVIIRTPPMITNVTLTITITLTSPTT